MPQHSFEKNGQANWLWEPHVQTLLAQLKSMTNKEEKSLEVMMGDKKIQLSINEVIAEIEGETLRARRLVQPLLVPHPQPQWQLAKEFFERLYREWGARK